MLTRNQIALSFNRTSMYCHPHSLMMSICWSSVIWYRNTSFTCRSPILSLDKSPLSVVDGQGTFENERLERKHVCYLRVFFFPFSPLKHNINTTSLYWINWSLAEWFSKSKDPHMPLQWRHTWLLIEAWRIQHDH